MSTIEPIEHFTGFGLYDRSFVNILRDLNDPIPFMRGIIAEFGYNYSIIEFEQPPRKAGKTHNNIMTLYSIAMRSFTNYTRMGIRTMSVLSCVGAGICLIIAIVYFILKLCNWNAYQTGTIPILLIILTLGFFQLFLAFVPRTARSGWEVPFCSEAVISALCVPCPRARAAAWSSAGIRSLCRRYMRHGRKSWKMQIPQKSWNDCEDFCKCFTTKKPPRQQLQTARRGGVLQ